MIDIATTAGFKLLLKSEINSNPLDMKDHPGGVWNLLPNLRNVAETDITRYRRKLPHQVDNSKLEIPVLNVLGMNSMGVLSPRESWGLNSL